MTTVADRLATKNTDPDVFEIFDAVADELERKSRLLRAQRLDRVEGGGPARRGDSGDQTGDEAHRQAGHDEAKGRLDGQPRHREPQELLQAEADAGEPAQGG